MIHNLPLLSLSGGLRVVLQLLLDGPYDLSPSLSLLFLSAFDRPESRQWLRPGVDVEVVLAGFTEVQPKGAGAEERVKACASVVGGWLGSWSGAFASVLFPKRCLRLQRLIRLSFTNANVQDSSTLTFTVDKLSHHSSIL